MLGTLINAGAILLGATIGLSTRLNVAAPRQQQIKILLGVAAAWFGLRLVWIGLASGTAQFFFQQLAVVLVAMVVGHFLGKLAGIQAWMNRLGQSAKVKLERATTDKSRAGSDGLMAAALLFCAAPLGIVGALEDGLSGYFAPLAIKAVMDGLAAWSFARIFGWTALLSAIPLAVFLAVLTSLGAHLELPLIAHGVIGVIHATAGLLVTYVALLIFEVRKVEIGNYLPALLVAPALMKLWQVLLH